MHPIYFVRHGESEWNVADRICGQTDVALTDMGHAQAIATGQKIGQSRDCIDEILYSPLSRAGGDGAACFGDDRRAYAHGTASGGTEFRQGKNFAKKLWTSLRQKAVCMPPRGRGVYAAVSPAHLQSFG